MSSHDYKSAQRPQPDELLVAIADYTKNFKVDSPQALRDREVLPDGHAGLRLPGAEVSGLHEVVRAGGAGRDHAGRLARAGHQLRAGPGHGRVQHRRHGALAGLQRHLAGRRMGPSLRQSRRHPLRGRLSIAPRHPAGGKAADPARRAHRHDQGARDPGRAGAGKQLQPRGPGSRAAGARGLDRGGHRHAGRLARADRQRAVECLDRRRRAAHLSPCAQHRLAQELGRGRRHQPRRAPRAVRAQERDGLSLGAERQNLGIPGRAVQGQAAHAGAAAGQLRHGERAVQDQLSGGVPCADRGRVRHGAASAG